MNAGRAQDAGRANNTGRARERFLARLAVPGDHSAPSDAAAPRARFTTPRRGPEGFMAAWQALGGSCETVESAGLAAAVAAYAERHEGPLLAAAGLDVGADLVWPACGHEAAAGAAVGVVRAAGAVAQTGTVLVRSDQNAGRAAGLLPPACVFVIDSAEVVETLGDFLRELEDPPSQLVTVTGPSRSADIESTLVIGVHGPGEVHAILTE